jgi:hypothetical protein
VIPNGRTLVVVVVKFGENPFANPIIYVINPALVTLMIVVWVCSFLTSFLKFLFFLVLKHVCTKLSVLCLRRRIQGLSLKVLSVGSKEILYLGHWNTSGELFAATRKRLITSWSVTLGVAAIVAAVKRLPLVSRCIIDAGVIVGLTVGSLSIMYHYGKSILTGELPKVDACLPTIDDNTASKSSTTAEVTKKTE